MQIDSSVACSNFGGVAGQTVSSEDEADCDRVSEPPPSLVDAVLEEYFERHHLSDRQKLVMRLYLRGISDKEIARSLGCSATTVREHWRRIVGKTSSGGRAGVIASLMGYLKAHQRLRAESGEARP